MTHQMTGNQVPPATTVRKREYSEYSIEEVLSKLANRSAQRTGEVQPWMGHGMDEYDYAT